MKELKRVFVHQLSFFAAHYARLAMRIIGLIAILFLVLGTMAGGRFVYETIHAPVTVTQQTYERYCRTALFEAELEHYVSNAVKHRFGQPLSLTAEMPGVCEPYVRTHMPHRIGVPTHNIVPYETSITFR